MAELTEIKKRNVAYKIRIGDLLKGRPVLIEGKFGHLDLGDKKVVRVNLIANCVDKFISDGEKKYASITLDDASGQVRIKAFGEDIEGLKNVTQGDTIQIIGNVREWNAEVYILPEVIKKIDPRWLLVRKLEIQKNSPSEVLSNSSPLRDIILQKIKDSEGDGGIEIDSIKSDVPASPKQIDEEIKGFLEEGLIYEPRPGRLRYLG